MKRSLGDLIRNFFKFRIVCVWKQFQTSMSPAYQIHVAVNRQIQYFLNNTRAVPLVRTDDAHQGRVSFFHNTKRFTGVAEHYPNLTVKKIPKQVLSRCEWGHDDYSLKVENLPKAPKKPGQQELEL